MRILILACVVALNFILQSTLFQYIEILGISPNTGMIIIVSFAYMRGEIEGAFLGLAVGLLQDMFFGAYIGINAMIYMITGLLCGKIFADFYKENYLIPLLLSFFGSFFYEFLYYATNILLRGYTDFFTYLRQIILPAMLYTALFSVFIYRLLYMLNRKLEKRENMKRKFY